MRKTFLTLSVGAMLLLTAGTSILTGCKPYVEDAPKAKYVIYLITDGTGINTVLGTEMMNAEVKGYFGRDTLAMCKADVVGVASTYSATNGVTDSAASGTALATGCKTYNSSIGMDVDSITPLYGLAYWAKAKGIPVGIATSVCINHVTPAAQYAHQSNRHYYYEIGQELSRTDFDFFGGSDFHVKYGDDELNRLKRDTLYNMCLQAGYTIVRSTAEYDSAVAQGAQKVIFFQDKERTLNVNDHSLPYNIDARPDEVSVYDIFKAQIDFLYRRSEALGDQGFFLMNEVGGKVDFACHAKDGATAFSEVMLVDKCFQAAYDFYLEHPKETLIVLTADHETGGLTIGNQRGHYNLRLRYLANQKCSMDQVTAHLQALRSQTSNRVTWDMAKQQLSQDLGLWSEINVREKDEAELREIWKKSFVGKLPNKENLYSENEPLASAAVEKLNELAYLGWNSYSHTAGLVPVYAVGVGAEEFAGHNDNTDIPLKIAKIARYEVKQRR